MFYHVNWSAQWLNIVDNITNMCVCVCVCGGGGGGGGGGGESMGRIGSNVIFWEILWKVRYLQLIK